ncbi:MAG TPA: hypothetical protein VK891_04490, partial [Euzebyales bacterium]|nr:hypothetical protein [Euzebyales bacterium]
MSDGDLLTLHLRTEGWAAGLRLAAMSLRDHRDPSAAVADLAGTERTIAEYLVTEVLDQQPPRVREILLQTSVVARLNADLAGALTGLDDCQQTLAQLERLTSSSCRSAPIACGTATSSCSPRYCGTSCGAGARRVRAAAPACGRVVRRPRRAVRGGLPRPAGTGLDDRGGLILSHAIDIALSSSATAIRELVERFPEDVIRGSPQLRDLLAFDSSTCWMSTRPAATSHCCASRRRKRPTTEARLCLRHGIPAVVDLRLSIAERSGNLDEALAAGNEIMTLQADAGAQVLGRHRDEKIQAVTLADLGVAELWTGRLDTV